MFKKSCKYCDIDLLIIGGVPRDHRLIVGYGVTEVGVYGYNGWVS